MNSDCSIGTVIRQMPDRPGAHEYHRADCGRFACSRCGAKKVWRYRKAIAQAAEARGLTRFVTLTLDPKRCSRPEDSQSYIRKCFDKLRVYLKRKFGTVVQYIVVAEFQKSGMAHLHALVDRYIPQDWLDQAWNAVGGGFTWINYVDVQRVSAYISKYLAKTFSSVTTGKKKRISTSRGIQLFSKRESTGWWWDRGSIRKFYDFAVKSRHRIENVGLDDAGLRSFEETEEATDGVPMGATLSQPF